MRKKILILILFFLSPFFFAYAEDGEVGSVSRFFIESSYDQENRKELDAKLVEITENLYFYVDKDWWDELSERRQNIYLDKINDLDEEFESNILDKMTEAFGNKPIHPVTGNRNVSVLFHPMQEGAGGYFNSGDQYSRYQSPRSNEISLLYLSTRVLDYEDKGGFLAHEFMHLLVFNQKERLRGVREEVWLNEARAEFMPTFLGYDDHEGSNLDKRMDTFLRDPDISLTEWVGQRADYGVVNIFTQYMVDHYGVDILIDSLKSSKVGIESINYALDKGGYEKNFNQVFDNFKVAVLVNDCDLGERFCFKSEDLKNLRISPATNYLPSGQRGSVSVQYRTKHWAGNWHKITGGRGTLELNFKMEEDLKVSIPYLLCFKEGGCEVERMKIDGGEGSLKVEGFNTDYESLTIMPSVQEKTEGFNGAEGSYLFSWEAELSGDNQNDRTLERLNLMREFLKRIRAILERRGYPDSCRIEAPLYYGIRDSQSVRCLQLFLATEPDIYPEAMITGNFLELTESAVIRFQEEHAEEILHPLGLDEGTGYVGSRTIAKINNLR